MGEFIRMKETCPDGGYKVGDVFRTKSQTKGGCNFVDKDGDGRFASHSSGRFEPWQPRVGERVRYRNAAYGEAIVKEVLPDGQFLVDTDGRYGICTERLKSLEPILSVAATAKQPATLKIEAGKFYKTRDGRKVGPMEFVDFGDGEPWHTSDTERWWSDDGSRRGGSDGESDDIIAEWIDEPVAKAEASNDNAQPKFKVGDRVVCPMGCGLATVTTVRADGRYLANWDDGQVGEVWWRDDDFELVTPPTTTTTTIVALIENGQPKPSTTPHVHASTGAAEKEAKRLAAKFKGQQFGVFTLTTTHEEAALVYDHKWQNLAALGLKIDAIKELRSITGMGLKPAKDAVEYFLDAA